jgi:hypothetical protein
VRLNSVQIEQKYKKNRNLNLPNEKNIIHPIKANSNIALATYEGKNMINHYLIKV